MKIIELLNKIANGEIKENTKFIDKYTHQEYIFKPKSYAGIYPPKNNVRAEENWFLSLNGCFRLYQEIEIIEEKKIPEKLNLDTDKLRGKETSRAIDYLIEDKINEIIDYLEENK